MSAHNDTAFLRMFLMILGALVAFTFIILIAANLITGVVEEEQGEDPRLRAVILERIKPIGSVNVAGTAAAPAAAATMSGADVVAASCNSCHSIGLLGAPKIGDKAAWSQRLAAEGGLDGLTASAIKGKNAMPPKGGAMVSDAEIRAAIEFMLTEAGVDAGAPVASAAPAVPAAQAPAPEAAAAAPAVAPEAPTPVVAEAPAADSGADLAKGKAVYGGACFVCHATGAAGAPKLGDKALWAPRIAQGMAVLETSALKGKGAMPPKGGRLDISDEDVKAAIAYMVSESQ